ncbi:MAG: PqqD family protein [Chromatiaceae bacterium]|nr:MAG: PqqD family protein [Chromatiaceae bacterium]
MTSTLTDTATPSPEVLFQEIAGEAVLLDLASETYFGLDDVGTRIWHLLHDHGSLRAVYDSMLNEYDVEPARLEDDLLAHVAQLADAGLVTLGAADHATP